MCEVHITRDDISWQHNTHKQTSTFYVYVSISLILPKLAFKWFPNESEGPDDSCEMGYTWSISVSNVHCCTETPIIVNLNTPAPPFTRRPTCWNLDKGLDYKWYQGYEYVCIRHNYCKTHANSLQTCCSQADTCKICNNLRAIAFKIISMANFKLHTSIISALHIEGTPRH